MFTEPLICAGHWARFGDAVVSKITHAVGEADFIQVVTLTDVKLQLLCPEGKIPRGY